VGRHVHDEHVADAPLGPQTGFGGGHRAHELIGVEAALHQQLALACVDQFDSLVGCGFAMLRVHKFAAANIQTALLCHARNPLDGSNQNRIDDAELGGFKTAAQRRLVAWMNQDRLGRWHLFGRRDQPVVF